MKDVESILGHMAEVFEAKIDTDYTVAVQLQIAPENSVWHVTVEQGKRVTMGRGAKPESQLFVNTDLDTLRRIADGEFNGLTAAAQATASDPAPLTIEPAEGLEYDVDARVRLYTFIQHFFNTSRPERIELSEERSRRVHGGHAIPLYYHPGFRSAWYMLKKGEKMNREGDTNPFPQAFVFLEGCGRAKIGDDIIDVRAGESYLVPPGSDHVVWNDNDGPLVLIWLAWGEGA